MGGKKDGKGKTGKDKNKPRRKKLARRQEKPIERAKNIELYCVCRQPYEGNSLMVQCDQCLGWFHPKCVGVSSKEAKDNPFICPSCQDKPVLKLANYKMGSYTSRMQLSYFESVDPQRLYQLYCIPFIPVPAASAAPTTENTGHAHLAEIISMQQLQTIQETVIQQINRHEHDNACASSTLMFHTLFCRKLISFLTRRKCKIESVHQTRQQECRTFLLSCVFAKQLDLAASMQKHTHNRQPCMPRKWITDEQALRFINKDVSGSIFNRYYHSDVDANAASSLLNNDASAQQESVTLNQRDVQTTFNDYRCDDDDEDGEGGGGGGAIGKYLQHNMARYAITSADTTMCANCAGQIPTTQYTTHIAQCYDNSDDHGKKVMCDGDGADEATMMMAWTADEILFSSRCETFCVPQNPSQTTIAEHSESDFDQLTPCNRFDVDDRRNILAALLRKRDRYGLDAAQRTQAQHAIRASSPYLSKDTALYRKICRVLLPSTNDEWPASSPSCSPSSEAGARLAEQRSNGAGAGGGGVRVRKDCLSAMRKLSRPLASSNGRHRHRASALTAFKSIRDSSDDEDEDDEDDTDEEDDDEDDDVPIAQNIRNQQQQSHDKTDGVDDNATTNGDDHTTNNDNNDNNNHENETVTAVAVEAVVSVPPLEQARGYNLRARTNGNNKCDDSQNNNDETNNTQQQSTTAAAAAESYQDMKDVFKQFRRRKKMCQLKAKKKAYSRMRGRANSKFVEHHMNGQNSHHRRLECDKKMLNSLFDIMLQSSTSTSSSLRSQHLLTQLLRCFAVLDNHTKHCGFIYAHPKLKTQTQTVSPSKTRRETDEQKTMRMEVDEEEEADEEKQSADVRGAADTTEYEFYCQQRLDTNGECCVHKNWRMESYQQLVSELKREIETIFICKAMLQQTQRLLNEHEMFAATMNQTIAHDMKTCLRTQTFMNDLDLLNGAFAMHPCTAVDIDSSVTDIEALVDAYSQSMAENTSEARNVIDKIVENAVLVGQTNTA